MAAVWPWYKTPAAVGGYSTSFIDLLPGTQKIPGMGVSGGWAFLGCSQGMWELQISTISPFMCLSPQPLPLAWGIQRSLLPRSASPWQGAGSPMQSPSGRSLMKLAN